jgi:hypothetical protein
VLGGLRDSESLRGREEIIEIGVGTFCAVEFDVPKREARLGDGAARDVGVGESRCLVEQFVTCGKDLIREDWMKWFVLEIQVLLRIRRLAMQPVKLGSHRLPCSTIDSLHPLGDQRVRVAVRIPKESREYPRAQLRIALPAPRHEVALD